MKKWSELVELGAGQKVLTQGWFLGHEKLTTKILKNKIKLPTYRQADKEALYQISSHEDGK